MRFIAVAALLLAGCAVQPIDVRVECPPMRTWTSAEQIALAAALAPFPQDSMLWQLEFDWQRQRDAIQACKAKPTL